MTSSNCETSIEHYRSLVRAAHVLVFALLVSAGSVGLGQQSPCTVPVNVIGPDLSSISKDKADETMAAWGEEWRDRRFPWDLMEDQLLAMPLWTPVRQLPATAFVARNERHPIPIRSIAIDRGPRRIVFVADNGKEMTAAARKIETAVITDILSKARGEDSFALLTARGPRVALPPGSRRETIEAAAEKLDSSIRGQSDSEGVLDALLEAATWLQPPRPGDSILIVAMRIEGRHKVSVSKVRAALRAGRIRLFGFQMGPAAVADPKMYWDDFAYSLSNGMLSLSRTSGGVAVFENTQEREYRLTQDDLKHLRDAAEQMYNAITEYYVLELSSVTPHLGISLSPEFQKRLPPAVLLYPRDVPGCSRRAAASPKGNGTGR